MNAASIAALAAVGTEFFFVAALFVYGPRLEPFFTPAPTRRPPRLHISRGAVAHDSDTSSSTPAQSQEPKGP